MSVTLSKATDHTTSQSTPRPTPRLPWYPLVGHRKGLRANDLGTLASAFWILALEGGTAHVSDRLS